MVKHASILLGELNFKIYCVDQSGCALLFQESELKCSLTSYMRGLGKRKEAQGDFEVTTTRTFFYPPANQPAL